MSYDIPYSKKMCYAKYLNISNLLPIKVFSALLKILLVEMEYGQFSILKIFIKLKTL